MIYYFIILAASLIETSLGGFLAVGKGLFHPLAYSFIFLASIAPKRSIFSLALASGLTAEIFLYPAFFRGADLLLFLLLAAAIIWIRSIFSASRDWRIFLTRVLSILAVYYLINFLFLFFVPTLISIPNFYGPAFGDTKFWIGELGGGVLATIIMMILLVFPGTPLLKNRYVQS